MLISEARLLLGQNKLKGTTICLTCKLAYNSHYLTKIGFDEVITCARSKPERVFTWDNPEKDSEKVYEKIDSLLITARSHLIKQGKIC